MAWYDDAWDTVTNWFSDSPTTTTDDASGWGWGDTTTTTSQDTTGGASGWGWDTTTSTDSSGNTTYTQPNGSSVTINANGEVLVNGQLFGNTNTTGSGSLDTSWGKTLSGIIGSLGSGAAGLVKGMITDNKGNIDGSKIASLAGGILGGINPNWMQANTQKTGYQGGIPSYSAVREQVPGTYDPNRRPGSRGQEYFTDVQYTSPTDVATAQATAAQQAQEAEARNKAREAETREAPQVSEYAAGGLANLAKGRYLGGPTDGMADKLPATIENKQPAKLSHGEFVVPADVVGHLGNGNSEAGAQRLYDMMDRIRKARTGTTKQGKQINPNKFMPG